VDDDAMKQRVAAAQGGDRHALSELLRDIQDDVFDLALRMLGDADDARDATQEVLVRVITKLSTFRGDSRFRTWVYRVAANALLDARGPLRRRAASFAETAHLLEAALDEGAGGDPPTDAAHEALANEVKLFCTHGMLLCLDRPHRLAYILGKILELPGEEAAAVLGTSPAAYRKRLSRARREMEEFLSRHCGLANPEHRCRCVKLVPAAHRAGVFLPSRTRLEHLPARRADRLRLDVERVRGAAEIYRSLPSFASPDDFAAGLRALLDGIEEERSSEADIHKEAS